MKKLTAIMLLLPTTIVMAFEEIRISGAKDASYFNTIGGNVYTFYNYAVGAILLFYALHATIVFQGDKEEGGKKFIQAGVGAILFLLVPYIISLING